VTIRVIRVSKISVGLKIFQELHPEFPGEGSEQQNPQLKTKQKGMTPMNTLIEFSDALCHPVSARRPTWPRGEFVNTTREQFAEIGRAFARGDKRTVDQACEELKATSLRRLRKTVSQSSPLNSCNEMKGPLMSQRSFNSNRRRLLFATWLSALCLIALTAQAATITVTNSNDSGAGSLRQALAGANDGDTVNFGITGTITLTTGELLVDKSVTISGPGAASLTVDGNLAGRVFHVSSGVTATIAGLTITNGNAQDDGPNSGGGIYNDHATLAVDNCTVSGNYAGWGGGGVHNRSGTLTVTNSTFSGNSANYLFGVGSGGGIFTEGYDGNATLTVTNSTFSGNYARLVGGGICNDAFGSATLTVSNSTFSGNSAESSGSGIFNGGSMTIGSTILNGGYGNLYNLYGTVSSLGYNLSSDDGGGLLTAIGDQINTDAMLGPLQDNGGPTFTHAPLTGSPAIDAGKNFTAGTTDQRGPGFVRTFDSASIANANGGDGTDIGAFEVQPPAPTYAGQVQAPINPDGSSTFSVRRGVVPVKFNLTQGGVATCDLPLATIAVTRTAGGVVGQVNESVYSGNADTGSNFRIDSCQYVYNLNSRALGVGTYRVDILIDGQVVGNAVFGLN
jgi:hypothetical protein